MDEINKDREYVIKIVICKVGWGERRMRKHSGEVCRKNINSNDIKRMTHSHIKLLFV